MAEYKLGDINISQKQFNDLSKIAMLGQLGLIDESAGKSFVAQSLMNEPEETPFQQYIKKILGGDTTSQPQDMFGAGMTQDQAMQSTMTQPRSIIPQSVLTREYNKMAGTDIGKTLGFYTPEEMTQANETQQLQSLLQSSPAFKTMPTFNTLEDVQNFFNRSDITEQEKIAFAKLNPELGKWVDTQLKQRVEQSSPLDLGFVGELAKSITAPIRTGIINPAAAILQTGTGVIGDVLGGKSLQESLASPERAITNQKPFLVTEQESQDYMSNPALGGLKSGVGIASYAAPTVLGKLMPGLTTPATTILGQGLKTAVPTAVSSGMFSYGTSRPGQELESTILGTGLGGAIGFGTGAIGKALSNLRNPTIPEIDKGVAQAKEALKKQGKKFFTEDYAVGKDLTNKRINYIESNFQGIEKQKAYEELLRVTPKSDKLRPVAEKASENIINRNLEAGLITPEQATRGLGKSPAQNIAGRLQEKVDNSTLNQFKKEFGTPPKSEGYLDLYKEASKYTTPDNRPLIALGDSADDVLKKATTNFEAKNFIIDEGVQELANQGTVANAQKILSLADDAVKNAKTDEALRAATAARDSLKRALSNAVDGNVPITDFRSAMKQVGDLTKVSKLGATPEATATASIYNKAYNLFREELNNKFAQSGLGNVIKLGKEVDVTRRLVDHMENTIAKGTNIAPPKTSFLQQATYPIVGGAVGGVPGIAAGFALNKVAESGLPGRILNQALQSTANRLGTMGSMTPTLGLGRGIQGIASTLTTPTGQAMFAPTISALGQALTPNGVTGQSFTPTSFPSSMMDFGAPSESGMGMGQIPSTMANQFTNETTGQKMGGGLFGGTDKQQFKEMLALGVLTGEITEGRANAINNLLGLTEKDEEADYKSAAQKMKIADTKIQIDNIGLMKDYIEKNKDLFTPYQVFGRVQDMPGSIFADPRRTEVTNTMNTVLSEVIKYLSGTATSGDEREFIQSLQPNLYMTPEVAMSKIKSLLNIANIKLKRYQEDPEAAVRDAKKEEQSYATTGQ